MVLKEWSEVWKIYNESGTRLSKLFWFPRKAKSYWYIWVINIFFIFSSVFALVYAVTDKKEMMALGWGLIGLTSVLGRFAVTKAFAKEFSVDYAAHGLGYYPRWTWRTYLHYALFLDELVDQKYSKADVAKLSGFADIATPPEVPKFQLSKYPGFMFVVGAITTLFINAIIKSSH